MLLRLAGGTAPGAGTAAAPLTPLVSSNHARSWRGGGSGGVFALERSGFGSGGGLCYCFSFLFVCSFCHFVVVCGCVWFGFVGLFFVLKVEAPAPHQGRIT